MRLSAADLRLSSSSHMQHGTAASPPPPPFDLVKTLRFRREEITTEFIREPVDADDTVPVELYSQPYDRLELQPDSAPYARIEIAHDTVATGDASNKAFRVVLALSILSWAFALGIGFAFLVL